MSTKQKRFLAKKSSPRRAHSKIDHIVIQEHSLKENIVKAVTHKKGKKVEVKFFLWPDSVFENQAQ